MLRLSASLVNQPVMSLRLGGRIALATEPIINPHNLKILGWWCKEPTVNYLSVLLAEDVREFTTQGIAVNDETSLVAPDDLVRHKEVLDIHFVLIDKTVRTKRSKLGKVSDYSYNEGMFVQKLYVARPIHKLLSAEDTLIIDRTQILEVTDKFILVRDTEVKETGDEFARAAAAA